MPLAARHERRVGLGIAHGLRRQVEQRRGVLREARLVPLPGALRADGERHLAVGVGAQPGPLARRAARRLEKGGEAEAAAHPPGLARGAARGKSVAVGEARALREARGHVAVADVHAHRGAQRRAEGVGLPQGSAGDPGLRGRRLDQRLDEEVRLGLAGAPVGLHRRGVGEGPAHLHRDQRDGVGPAHRRARGLRRAPRAVGGEVCAHLRHRRHLEREEPPPRVERQRRLRVEAAAVGGACHVLRGRRHPAHRRAEQRGCVQQAEVLGKGRVLEAEAAAHIRRRDAQPRGIERHRGADRVADAVHALAAQQQLEPLARRAGECGARLERKGRDAAVRHGAPHHVRGVRHGPAHGRRVAASPQEREIARCGGVQQRCAVGERVMRVGDGGQQLPRRLKRLGRVARRHFGLRHDQRHRLAHEARAAAHQRRPRRRSQGHLAVERGGDGQGRPGRQFGARQHEPHARCRARRGGAERDQPRMRVGAAQEHRVQRSAGVEIGEVAPGPGEEPRILAPPQARPDHVRVMAGGAR